MIRSDRGIKDKEEEREGKKTIMLKKRRKKSNVPMKTNELLKLWWEELMNINFYYSDYKIYFKIG